MITPHPHSLCAAESTAGSSRTSHPCAMGDFDHQHERALQGIWFLGDVHGEFRHIAQALQVVATVQTTPASRSTSTSSPALPSWLVFLGDVDIDHQPFREALAPLRRNFPAVKVAFIHGNHDADTYEHWACLHDCGDAVALHGQVVEMNGVRIAGLGGNFLGRIWSPPGEVFFANKTSAMNQGAFQWRGGQKPNPKLHGAIYPDDVKHLASLRADILVTHEAPSCHPYGFAALDELARSMRVVRSFHGHQHDDRSAEYALHVALASSGAVFYTPTVGLTLRELRKELPLLMSRVEICIDQHLQPEGTTTAGKRGKHVGLIIIDEADRLSMTALEYLRDFFDRQGIGLILIGMPGIDKRLSRYPQLYSRVGFAHVYRPLQDEELAFVLTTRWRHLGVELDDADFTDVQAVASIVRLTGGNFRLVHRLLVQIERIHSSEWLARH